MFPSSGKKFDVVTIGSAVRDIMFFTPAGKLFKTPEDLTAQKMWAFEYGAKVEIDSFCDSLGGGAFNTAYNFNKLGLKTAPLVRLGNDVDGQWVKKHMQKHNISTALVQTDDEEKTGISLVMCSQKKEPDHIIFVHRGANASLMVNKKTLSKVKTSWFFINSLAGKKWDENVDYIFEHATNTSAKVAWNPGGRQLKGGKKKVEKFLKKTDVLILNKDEAIELVLSGIRLGNRDPKFLNKPVYLLNMLSEWGPKIVVITLGNKGAVALKSDKMYKQKVINTKVVDTTGVGDAFGAAFISGLFHTNNVQTALQWGCANSSYVVTKAGAHQGVMERSELEKAVVKNFGK